MFKDLNINANNNNSLGDTRIKSSQSNSPSFRATNPNAVDTTPTADTYSPQPQAQPQAQPQYPAPPVQFQPEQEMSMGEKYIKYGIPSGLALYAGSELFDKANGGSYEKSLVGRLGRLGDRISNSSVLQNSTVDSIKTTGSAYKQKLKDFVLRHPRLRAMYETPTSPECQMVTTFLETQADHDLSRGIKKLEKNFLTKNPKTLKLAGATEAEIEAFKTRYGTGLFGKIKNESAAVEEFLVTKLCKEHGYENLLDRYQLVTREIDALHQQLNIPGTNKQAIKARLAELENIRKTQGSQLLTSLKHKHVGIKPNEISAIEKDVAKNAGRIEHALEKAKGFSPKINSFYNQILSGKMPTTRLGKLLPKMAKLGMRGLTFGGGLVNCVLFLGFFIGEAVKNTIDAPKGQKLSTAVHGFNDAISWIIAMPIALKAMHSVNGLKNLGKTKEQVNAIDTARKAFNKNVKAGLLTDRAAYDAGLAELNAVKAANAGVKQKGLNKVLSKVANFLSVGLGQTAKYKEATAPLAWRNIGNVLKPSNLAKVGRNMMRNLPNFGRNFVGYPLRFALYMFAFQPLVDKLFTGPLNVLFGKPYDPEKIKEEREKELKTAAELYPGPSIVSNPDAAKGLEYLDPNTLSDTNLVKQELVKRGSITPGQVPSQSQQGVNGNPAANNNPTGDPNISDYDTVPRTYVPQIDYNNPIPYPDPQDPKYNPNYEQNYDNAKKQYDKTERLIADVEAFINEKNK